MSRIWRVITAALSCPVWVPKKRPSPLCVLALDPSSGHLTRTSVFLCHFQSSNSEYTGFLAPLCHWTPFCRPQDGWEVGGWGQWAAPGILTDPKIGLFWYAGCATVHCALCTHTWQQSSAESFQICILSRRVTDAESSILCTLDFFGPEKASLKSSHPQVSHVSQSLV